MVAVATAAPRRGGAWCSVECRVRSCPPSLFRRSLAHPIPLRVVGRKRAPRRCRCVRGWRRRTDRPLRVALRCLPLEVRASGPATNRTATRRTEVRGEQTHACGGRRRAGQRKLSAHTVAPLCLVLASESDTHHQLSLIRCQTFNVLSSPFSCRPPAAGCCLLCGRVARQQPWCRDQLHTAGRWQRHWQRRWQLREPASGAAQQLLRASLRERFVAR